MTKPGQSTAADVPSKIDPLIAGRHSKAISDPSFEVHVAEVGGNLRIDHQTSGPTLWAGRLQSKTDDLILQSDTLLSVPLDALVDVSAGQEFGILVTVSHPKFAASAAKGIREVAGQPRASPLPTAEQSPVSKQSILAGELERLRSSITEHTKAITARAAAPGIRAFKTSV